MHLTNQKPTCFLTGCSGYIGSHIAQSLLKQNWQIWGITRKKENISTNPDINWLIADLADLNQLETIQNRIPPNTSFDAIIHCAGVSPDQTILNLDQKNFQDGMAINFLSIQKLNQMLIKSLRKKGKIIHFGSRVAKHGNPGQIAYGTAKGILADYTKLLAAELGSNEMTVNMILPGVHPSEILGPHREKIMDTATKESVLHRLTNIEDVVNAVNYLLNAHSVSGQIFAIESRLIE